MKEKEIFREKVLCALHREMEKRFPKAYCHYNGTISKQGDTVMILQSAERLLVSNALNCTYPPMLTSDSLLRGGVEITDEYITGILDEMGLTKDIALNSFAAQAIPNDSTDQYFKIIWGVKINERPPLGVMPENLWIELRITELARAIHDRVFSKRMGEINGMGGMSAHDYEIIKKWASELAARTAEAHHG